jgi:hypothetical protein
MEGYERKNKEEIHKELQDLDPIGSPHIEEKMIGGNVDLDLLSLFPQKDARIMGGMGRKEKLFKVNNGGERNGRANLQMRKKGLYIAPARNLTITGRNFWPEGKNSAPLIKFPAQISAPLTEGCTTKDLGEFRRAGNYGISAPQKFWPRGRNFRPGRKHQYENGCNFLHPDSVFDDLGLVGITTTTSTPSSIETS